MTQDDPRPRKRGRPTNSASRALRTQDEAIARTVGQMCAWGHPLRGVVLKSVAAACQAVWRRSLTQDGIEAIHERVGTVGYDDKPQKAYQWSRHPAPWRRETEPIDARDMTPVDIAVRLLRLGGHWQSVLLIEEEVCTPGDRPLTPAAEADLVRFRLKRAKTG